LKDIPLEALYKKPRLFNRGFILESTECDSGKAGTPWPGRASGSNINSFLTFGGVDSWVYINASYYCKHDDPGESTHLYIGFCTQGKGHRVIDTPEIVIRLKNTDQQ
jgi:hypothetical protein